MNITYHKAIVDDITTLVKFRLEFLMGLLGNASQESSNELEKSIHAYYKRELNGNKCLSYIAISNNMPVGTGGLIVREQPGSFNNPSGRSGYVFNMYTILSFRRKGICSNILRLLVDDARELGITAFELFVTKEGEFVYKQEGFEMHKEPAYRKYF